MKFSQAAAPAFWGAVAGAVLLAFIGFKWGGWVTASTAQQMATTQSQNAVVRSLAPYCVARFERLPNAAAEWTKLKKTDDFDQDSFLEKAGVVTPQGSKIGSDTTDAVASACATKLVAMKQLASAEVAATK